jgi:ribonucleoside-diphosphate reductase alpha chain
LCMKTIRDAALESSTSLAKEKSSFPFFNANDYLATEYARSLSVAQHELVKANGLRNGLLTSIAPTGTISLLAGNVSSGIEPIFNAGYERNITNPDGSHRTELLEDYAIALWRSQSKGLPPAFVTVDDLKPVDHLNMAAAVQPFVDSSISKTVNVPEMIDFESFTSIYEEAYALGLKGCTTFRPNEITGSILVSAPAKELCPSCGSDNLVAKEGCKSCSNCGFALCG